MMKRLFIIDASGYLYRSYHAIQNLTNAQGESTNALYGFIRSLLKLIKDFEPKHMVAVFDGPKGTERRKTLYPNYKANRKAMPEDLRYQIEWAQEFCDLLGIPKLVVPQVEADDTMGSVAKWAEQKGTEVYLCTSDKDLCQLVSEKIFVLNTHKNNLIMGSKEVKESFGVSPSQMIDYLAIVGDASDNVPGIPGFGAKTAAKVLEEIGTLDHLLSHPEKLKGKKQEAVRTSAGTAKLSQKLVTIDTSIDFPKEGEFFEMALPKLKELQQFYTDKNFNTLSRELKHESENEEQLDYALIDDESSLDQLIEVLQKEKEICFDTETTHWHPLKAELVGIGFCIKQGAAWYIPMNGKLGLEKALKKLAPLFENSRIGFYAHHLKYDLHILKNYGISLANISFDTILASYILTPHLRQHSLDALTLEHFGKTKIPTSDLIGKGKNQITMLEVPIEKVCAYCCEDVDYTYRLKQIFASELKKRKLEPLLFDLELPLLKVLSKMEREGIFLDAPILKTLEKAVNTDLQRLENEIHAIADEPFNLKSPKQLSGILFEKMKIPPPKKTATGYSTSAEVLETLQNEYAIAKKMLEFRSLEKLRSSYIETLPKEINPKTGRIHPTFNQSVAATGRLSCQDPNLQQIPIRTPLGREVRKAFRPEKQGWSYLSADYSQIELRLLAHFSEDPTLISAFENNEDIHTHTAATVLNIPLEQVTKEQRRQAKAVNFGILYGQQAWGLSKELGISLEEASVFIKTYFQRYQRVKDFVESCKEKTRKTGRAMTIIGRERPIPEIDSKNPQIRGAAERLAVNTPLQGTAADLIKKAMIVIDEKLMRGQHLGFMILQIHDELIFEIPDFEITAIEQLVISSMEGVYQLRVPLTVDVSIGKNWKEC
ncbi:DNA polymerase I [Waddlia chondrophila 2032/99]|uniref:DNA polymerase I n=1 Tax=Waddlia chondrophila 2032/99 TaxID=765953 RepID=F8LF43_9BACT|nr:DNA polymerase I [Waddlia chondrophila 2032/99]